MTERHIPMLEALHARQPNEALASKLHLYGQFVGSWHVDIDFHPLNGSTRRAEGEWHFSWVLDGRAIQDVWIFPARRLRGDEKPAESLVHVRLHISLVRPSHRRMAHHLVRSHETSRNAPDRPSRRR